MVTLTEKAEQWPRRNNGQIVFKTSNEAIFYANLIHNNIPLRDEIEHYLHQTRSQLRIERDKIDPNYDHLMQIAVKAQFFKECLEEVKRIHNER